MERKCKISENVCLEYAAFINAYVNDCKREMQTRRLSEQKPPTIGDMAYQYLSDPSLAIPNYFPTIAIMMEMMITICVSAVNCELRLVK